MSVVELRPIDTDNWEACIALKPADEQVGFLEPNVVSIAESRVHPWMLPLAIYHANELVGFVMYSETPDPRADSHWVHRLMIDQRFQGRGYGRAAMQEVIRRCRAIPSCDALWIGYTTDNELARRFYLSLGFIEQGEAPWGDDLVARLLM
jgi:diamine N-acetyltransferase